MGLNKRYLKSIIGKERSAVVPPSAAVVQAPIASREAGAAFEAVNALQVRYRAFSRVNRTGAVIPARMATAVYRALESLSGRVGDIDAFVCDRLRWSLDEMGRFLTSEQIDAVALAVDAADHGRGFIVADQTGFGKGRILAATARERILAGKKVIFFTEKANLFSDFWRDVRDIGSSDLFGRPFMLNDKSNIIDSSSVDARILEPAWKKKDVDDIIRSGALDQRIMMTTYSQFNRDKTLKVAFLNKIAVGAHFIFDEAQNFVGADSTTGKIISSVIVNAASTTFSSATFARDVTNLAAYPSVFPWLSKIRDFSEISTEHKNVLAEESALKAAENGSIIRREHDMSNLTMNIKVDVERQSRNFMLMDRLYPILSELATLSGDVDDFLIKKNMESKKEHRQQTWSAANFGVRLHAIISQFQVALGVDSCVDECVDSLMKGEKPVVVIESTMESLIRFLQKDLGDQEQDDDDVIEDESGYMDDNEASEADIPDRVSPPSFGNALTMMLDRMLKVSVRTGPERVREVVVLDQPFFVAAGERIREKINTFPFLSLSPIDDIRDRIEDEGRRRFEAGIIKKPWRTDEISARSVRVQNGAYTQVQKPDRNSVVAGFVNGATQALLITQAGSTGLSIHDHEAFADHAPRHMIELRSPRNVMARIQTWGRVFRRGQRTEPRFATLSTGLPFEVYDLAIQNQKILKLSASVTGVGNSLSLMDVFDPVDAVGNRIARDLLIQNRSLAKAMGINLRVDEDAAKKSLYFIGKFLRRLCLLDRATQSTLYADFVNRYRSHVPAEDDVTDLPKGPWSIVSQKRLDPGSDYVSLTTIRMQQNQGYCALSSADVREMINDAEHRWVGLAEHARKLRSEIRSEMRTFLDATDFTSIDKALGSGSDNLIKQKKIYFDLFMDFLREIRPGFEIKISGGDGIILDVIAPPIADAVNAGAYKVRYIAPGDAASHEIDLSAILDTQKSGASWALASSATLSRFDHVSGGAIEKTIIDGDAVQSVLACHRVGTGSKILWTDENGVDHFGMIIPDDARKRVLASPVRVSDPEIALSILEQGGRIFGNAIMPGAGFSVFENKNTGAFTFSVPGSDKKLQAEIEPVVDIIGELSDGYDVLMGVIPRSQLGSVVAKLIDMAGSVFIDGRFRDQACLLAEKRLESVGFSLH